MVRSSEFVTDGLGAAVLKEHAIVVTEGGAAKRRLDADARGASGEHQGLGSQGLQTVIKIGLVEAIVGRLLDRSKIAGERREVRHDVGLPHASG